MRSLHVCSLSPATAGAGTAPFYRSSPFLYLFCRPTCPTRGPALTLTISCPVPLTFQANRFHANTAVQSDYRFAAQGHDLSRTFLQRLSQASRNMRTAYRAAAHAYRFQARGTRFKADADSIRGRLYPFPAPGTVLTGVFRYRTAPIRYADACFRYRRRTLLCSPALCERPLVLPKTAATGSASSPPGPSRCGSCRFPSGTRPRARPAASRVQGLRRP